MRNCLKIFLLFVCLLGFNNLKATHVMGSDVTWECIGQDTFKVRITLYRDCNGCTIPACAFPVLTATSTCGTKTFTTVKTEGKDITPVCDKQCTRCVSPSCDFKYGIFVYYFDAVVILTDWRKKNCCEVKFSYVTSARNGAITTGAANQNIYVEALVNICLDPCDNSPTFEGSPLAIICRGRDFIFNQDVQDRDVDPKTGIKSDSLVFSWGVPMLSSTTKTTWSGGYSYDKPLNYLGFEFYGYQTLIKSKNLAKFYREMKETIKRKHKRIEIIKEKHLLDEAPVFKRKIYRLFSFKGERNS